MVPNHLAAVAQVGEATGDFAHEVGEVVVAARHDEQPLEVEEVEGKAPEHRLRYCVGPKEAALVPCVCRMSSPSVIMGPKTLRKGR